MSSFWRWGADMVEPPAGPESGASSFPDGSAGGGPRPGRNVPSPALRRLHPATVLIEFLRRLGSLAYFIAGVLLLRMFGRGGGDWYDWILAGVALFGTVEAALRYASLRYGLEGERLVLRSGILVRQKRTIPLDRIQNIELKRGVLHRALGVADLEIETAGGVEPEARLSALSVEDAARLKVVLLRRRSAAEADEAAEAVVAPLWRSTLVELLLLGATENRAGLIIGSLAGLWYSFGEVLQAPEQALQRWFTQQLGRDAYGAGLTFAVIAAALVLAGWLVSITLTVTTYHGFVLRQTEGRLRRRFGLFTQRETVLPLERVQVVRIDAPLPRRLLGFATIFAETAGSVLNRELGGSTPLCPLIRSQRAVSLLRELLPAVDLAGLTWRPVSRRTIRRGLLRYLAIGLTLLAAAACALSASVLTAAPIVALLAWLAALARYRSLGYAESGQYLLARCGVWTRRTWIVPRGKVQSVDCRQSPFQRRLKLASLSIATAAGRGRAASPTIVDLPAEEALALQDRLSRDAAAHGAWPADGV